MHFAPSKMFINQVLFPCISLLLDIGALSSFFFPLCFTYSSHYAFSTITHHILFSIYTNWCSTSIPTRVVFTRNDRKASNSRHSDFHFSSIFHNPMLSCVRRSICTLHRGCNRFIPPALIRGASTGKTENPNHPTPLSIEKLKYYAESQDNMPVRLSLAKFISTELPIRFAVISFPF